MKKRPLELYGYTKSVDTGCGKMYITFNFDPDNNELFEVFLRLGKAGGCAFAQNTSIGMLVTYICRTSGFSQDIAKLLSGVQCTESKTGTEQKSCADALAKLLQEEIYELDSLVDILVTDVFYEKAVAYIKENYKEAEEHDATDTRRHFKYKGHKFINAGGTAINNKNPAALRIFKQLLDHVEKGE